MNINENTEIVSIDIFILKFAYKTVFIYEYVLVVSIKKLD